MSYRLSWRSRSHRSSRSASPNGVDDLDLLIATSVIPDEPDDGALYMDDGTNRQDGAIGLRLYDGAGWMDL